MRKARKSTLKWIYSTGAIVLIAFLLVATGGLLAINQRLQSIHEPTLRLNEPTHLLLVALDSRWPGEGGLPDALILLDLETGNFSSIPRDWRDSNLEPETSLVEKYLGLISCEPFCGIQGVYGFGQLPDSRSEATPLGLAKLARTVKHELQLGSVAFISFDLTWAYSFLTRLGALEVHVSEPVPVGGVRVSGTYQGVERYIRSGTSQLEGEDLFWVARARFGSSNADRIARQEALIESALSQKSAAQLVRAAWGARGYLATDLTLSETLFIASKVLGSHG